MSNASGPSSTWRHGHNRDFGKRPSSVPVDRSCRDDNRSNATATRVSTHLLTSRKCVELIAPLTPNKCSDTVPGKRHIRRWVRAWTAPHLARDDIPSSISRLAPPVTRVAPASSALRGRRFPESNPWIDQDARGSPSQPTPRAGSAGCTPGALPPHLKGGISTARVTRLFAAPP